MDGRLPALVREIAGAAGLSAALALVDAQGGCRIYVPAALTADHPLASVMGLEGATALCGLYGGEFITLPASPRRGTKLTRRLADQALAEGGSVNEAVRRSGLTSRAVYYRKAARKRQEAERGSDLFDALKR